MLSGLKKIHFVGIGGVGMSALARILLDKGYEVSGSDLKTSPLVEKLKAHGARICLGHSAENLSDAEAIVVSTAISANNPEIVKAAELGLKKFHRSDVNAALLNKAKGIAIAGAHGKTTTSAMTGVLLEYANLDPTVIIGGEVDYFNGNAILGKGEYLVSEADESDGSFLSLRPYISVVTNIEDDHMDYYKTMDNLFDAFRKFMKNTAEDGELILCFDSENVRKLAHGLNKNYISYAIDHDAMYRAINIEPYEEGVSFEVLALGENIGKIILKIPGRHNVLNALAAIIVARLAGIEMKKIAEGFSLFRGAKRRFETKGCENGIWVVDDYAHHPTEIAATLSAARQTTAKRVICAFQPHRYTRTQLLADEFATCFGDADILLLTDIYSAGEEPIAGIDGRTIVKSVTKATEREPIYIEKREAVAEHLAKIAKEGDIVITMGAGDIVKTSTELLALLKEKKTSANRKIVVVMGGPSSEAEVSRNSGNTVLKALREKGYCVEGLEFNPKTFVEEITAKNCAIVFNAMHGRFGEDGILPAVLNMLDIPCTGPDVLSSVLTINKATTKRILEKNGILTPRSFTYQIHEKEHDFASEILGKFTLPVVVKAATQGSSIGVIIVEKEQDLKDAIMKAFDFSEEVVVEEFIRGRELTVAVAGRKSEAEAFPIVEITTLSGKYDYESKYTAGASTHIVPAQINEELTEKIKRIAEQAFLACGCIGIARIDFMLSEDNVPYAIEINTVPGMTELSLMPDAAKAKGMNFGDLCEYILELAGF